MMHLSNLLHQQQVKDNQKAQDNVGGLKTSKEMGRVGAAVGVGAGTDERIVKLLKLGLDVLLIDTSHGPHKVLDRVKQLKSQTYYPDATNC